MMKRSWLKASRAASAVSACGGSEAGRDGNVGANLAPCAQRRVRPPFQVTRGGGDPSFAGQRSATQAEQPAVYVSTVAGR
jgi:hypothetical protein